MTAEVVRLTAARDRQLTTTLRQLLELAERGELRGYELAAEDIRGSEKFFVVGSYKARPQHGAQAAMRLAMRMGNLADQRQEDDDTLTGHRV
jgi:hypothetical protein